MAQLSKEFGKHYLVELTGCNAEKMKYIDDVKGLFDRAAVKSRATILESSYHQFKPSGVSGMIFIEESHFSIHTWPEDRYVGFDILTCGDMSPEAAIEELKNGFEAKEINMQIIPRGY